MPWCEYMSRVTGHSRERKERRAELRAVIYPLYYLMHKKGFTGQPMKPEEFLPIDGEGAEQIEITDSQGVLKRAFERMNPHMKGKKYIKPQRRRK